MAEKAPRRNDANAWMALKACPCWLSLSAFNIRRYKIFNNYRSTDTSQVDPAHSLAFRNFRPYVSVWHALPRNEMTEQFAGILRIFLLITQLTPHGAAAAGQVHIQHETEKNKLQNNTRQVPLQPRLSVHALKSQTSTRCQILATSTNAGIYVHHCVLPLRGWPSVPGEYPRVENKVWSSIKVACLFFLPREAEAPLHK